MPRCMHQELKVAAILALSAAACSQRSAVATDDGSVDARDRFDATAGDRRSSGDRWPFVADAGWSPDRGPLYDCVGVGTSCNPHDACAMSPTCGADLKCHAAYYQSCGDSLPCTKDICGGAGICRNEPIDGYCVLSEPGQPLACYQLNQRSKADPCLECDSSTDPHAWSPANGGACDDKDPCTKDDYCRAGVCQGTSYVKACTDQLACTEDLCDGRGGCLGHPLRPGYCLIDGVCFLDGEKDASGCNVCDVSKSTSSWTPTC